MESSINAFTNKKGYTCFYNLFNVRGLETNEDYFKGRVV